MAHVQICAYISKTTKERVERYAEAHGMKSGRLVEEALLYHLQALRELPAEMIMPPRLELTRQSFQKVTDLLRHPRKPTKALRDLMAGR